MSKTLLIRVDDIMKKVAEELFTSLGLDTSTAIRIFLSIVIETGSLLFELKLQFSLLSVIITMS